MTGPKTSLKTKVTTMQTVDRSLELINLLASAHDGLSALELSKLLNITRTSTYAILNSFINQGFVEQISKTGRYTIGYRFFTIGSQYQYQYPFIGIVKKYIDHLDSRFQVNVSVLKPGMQLLILLARESVYVPTLIPVHICPAYACASGKVLLSYLPEHELDALVNATEFQPFTSKTVKTAAELKEQIALVKAQGYATEEEEMLPGRGCIAFPIFDASGMTLGTISLSGKIETIAQEKAALIRSLQDVATVISSELGYSILTSQKRFGI